jgi:Tol biopolymer transport system component
VYEVVDAIGVGGMGTVYRARDTRLPREAAIKVSAENFSERFSREAHAIASLNHPNITTLYDVGPDYLVMEMVEGPTLAERIKEGPLTLEDAATIGRQIADALDYAHERGIIHRDLKPGNVKIRPDGLVKVLDFGLAKSGAAHATQQPAESPTMSAHQTAAGVIVGTFAYMSPEQLTGKTVDRRTDVWAFGCVFYEMLTGESVHRGDTSQEVMASVLRDNPDLTKVPAQARRMLKRCLEKDPQKRLRHIGDVMALLDDPPSGEVPAVAAALPGSRAPNSTKWMWPAVAAVVIAAGATLYVWAPWRSHTNPGQAVRFEVPETDKLKFFYGAAMSVSPDGHWMVFPATGEDGVARYWLRSLDTVEARALPGTETAYVPAAWTADSRYVLFTTINHANTLRMIDIEGGPAQTLSTMAGGLNGASGNHDGVIVFASSLPGPIFRVSPTGDAPIALTAVVPGELGHEFPQFLPDGRHFLYFRNTVDASRAGVYVGALDVKPDAQSPTRLLATNREAYFARSSSGSSGRLLFLRDTTLMAQSFDPNRLELSGDAVPIAEGVNSFTPRSYGMFSVSDTDTGALVYRAGVDAKLAPTWFDASGRSTESLDAGDYAFPAISPDGTRIAVALGPVGSRDIWTIDVARKTRTRLTFDPANDDQPVWSPDGKTIAFASNRSGQNKMYVKPADGSDAERLLTEQPGIPTSWSRDGRFLLFDTTSPVTRVRSGREGPDGGQSDIWVLPMTGQTGEWATPYPVLATRFSAQGAVFSPDSRWIAYMSIESSQPDVYVRPFVPDARGSTGAKWLVSAGGLPLYPRWSSSGKQLFYMRGGTFDVMAVDIDTRNGFQAGTPRRLFAAPPPLAGTGWALSPDDKRFLFITTPNGGRTAPFTVVLNWAAALKK